MREDTDCGLTYLAIRLGRDNTLVCSLQERNLLSTSDNKETVGVAALGRGASTVKLSIFFSVFEVFTLEQDNYDIFEGDRVGLFNGEG